MFQMEQIKILLVLVSLIAPSTSHMMPINTVLLHEFFNSTRSFNIGEKCRTELSKVCRVYFFKKPLVTEKFPNLDFKRNPSPTKFRNPFKLTVSLTKLVSVSLLQTKNCQFVWTTIRIPNNFGRNFFICVFACKF